MKAFTISDLLRDHPYGVKNIFMFEQSVVYDTNKRLIIMFDLK
jgi:hypothetical protein